jgi:nucleotide-binding universal stress UspA family protein
MALFEKTLFPVDFSASCVAMAAYVKRSAALLGAKVTLIHVVDPVSFSAFALYSRPMSELAEDYLETARKKLDGFLAQELPADQYERIVTLGDPATEIARIAKADGFNLIIMPTHAGYFRQKLIGSTTAKVLNDAHCPVLTSTHAQKIAPRPPNHREWLCAVGLHADSDRVLRFATEGAAQAQAKLSLIHAIQAADPDLPIQMDLKERIRSAETELARSRVDELQRKAGSAVPVRIAIGSVKEALIAATLESDADVLIVGRSSQPGSHGRMRDLTYTLVRDSPFPVVSV